MRRLEKVVLSLSAKVDSLVTALALVTAENAALKANQVGVLKRLDPIEEKLTPNGSPNVYAVFPMGFQ